jgi:heat shock protein HtpX
VLGFVLSAYLGDPSIVYIAVIFSIIMNIGSYWFSDKIVLKLSGATEADANDFRGLHDMVENLAITAGLPKPRVYIIDDPVPNAFATGRDKEHAAVAFTTGLLGMLSNTELEGVVAHELAHIDNKDILLQTVVVVLVGFVTLLSDFFLRSLIWGGDHRDSRSGGGQLGIILLIIGIVLAILSPFVAMLIQLMISRKREFLADATGVLYTRYPEGLVQALEKIDRFARPMKRANHATAHLYISDPFKEHADTAGADIDGESEPKKIRGFHKLFLTHPPTDERIEALRKM